MEYADYPYFFFFFSGVQVMRISVGLHSVARNVCAPLASGAYFETNTCHILSFIFVLRQVTTLDHTLLCLHNGSNYMLSEKCPLSWLLTGWNSEIFWEDDVAFTAFFPLLPKDLVMTSVIGQSSDQLCPFIWREASIIVLCAKICAILYCVILTVVRTLFKS